MRALLDTHAFLWFILDDSQLSQVAQAQINDPIQEILVSPASYWEIAIKINLGKYALPQPYQTFMETHIAINDFTILPILPKHTALLTTLRLHHRDPFDRLLVAQALTESIPIISADTQFDPYGVQRIW
ncbi:MAG: type II toxin-antitoxin system VapC family toxin [Planctomycetales bacterium]